MVIKNYNEFISEGNAWKANTTKDDDVKIDMMKYKLEDYVKSLGCEIEEIGNDFEVHMDGDHILQVMLRPTFIGIKKVGNKFPEQFEYNALGKVKSELSNIIKSI